MKDGLEVTDEVFESAGQHRLRAGREPPAHDQGDPRGHDRVLTAPSKPTRVPRRRVTKLVDSLDAELSERV